MIYFTSDLHFYHENIIRICDRPFGSVEEMNEALIDNWNSTVMENDEVYILGDVTLKGAEDAMTVLRRLNGRKYLVRGNHDLYTFKQGFDKSIFEWSRDYYLLNFRKMRFVLFHYPIDDWNFMYYGAYHLHGHQHNKPEYNLGNLAKGIRKYDVGVEANSFKPVSIEDILEFFKDTRSPCSIDNAKARE